MFQALPLYHRQGKIVQLSLPLLRLVSRKSPRLESSTPELIHHPCSAERIRHSPTFHREALGDLGAPDVQSQISEVAQTDVAACAVGRWPARDPVVSLYTSLGGVCDGSDKILPVARSVVNSIFGGSGTENREGPPCAIGILPRKVVPFLLLACLLDPGLVTTPSFPTRLRGDGRNSLAHHRA